MRGIEDLQNKCESFGEAILKHKQDFVNLIEYIQSPDDPTNCDRLTRFLIDQDIPIGDALHEHLLLVFLKREPTRRDLTKTLLSLRLANSRPSLPAADIHPRCAEVSLEVLVEASCSNDCEGLADRLSALWQAVIQYPQSPRGYAEYAFALSEVGLWEDSRQAVRAALLIGIGDDLAAASVLATAVNLMSEQKAIDEVEAAVVARAMPTAVRHIPEVVSLMIRSGDTDAPLAVPAMLAANADRSKASLVGFLSSFEQSDMEGAYQHLREAFERDPSETLREVVTVYHSMVGRVVEELGVADEIGAWLGEALTDRACDTIISPLPGIEVRNQVRAARAEAMEKGLPSVFLITHPKTASVSIGNIFQSGFALPTAVYSLGISSVVEPWLKDYQRGGACYVTHLDPRQRNVSLLAHHGVSNVIVNVRDPRQLVVSNSEHFRKYPEQLPLKERNAYLADPDAHIHASIERTLGYSIPWLQGWVTARESLRVDFTHYEKFQSDREAFLDEIVDFYGGDRAYFNRTAALTEHAGTDYHRRLGCPDEWRKRLTPRDIDLINQAIPSVFWDIFGWKE